MKIKSFIPYHVQFEETLISIISSIFFKELELMNQRKTILSEIIEKPQYGYTARASKESIGIKYVRITDIQAGKIDWDSVPYCKCANPKKYLLKEDNILFARTGGTTGKSFIIKGRIPKSVFASYLIRVRTKKGINPEFLYWFFKTKQYWSQIKEEKMGSAQPNVNARKLSSLEIHVPETGIQEAMAKYLNAFKNRIYGQSVELPTLPMKLEKAEKKAVKIESLMLRIEKTKKLRTETSEDLGRLLPSEVKRIIDSHKPSTIKKEPKEKQWFWLKLPKFVSDEKYAIKRGPFGSSLRKEFFVPSGFKVYEQKNVIKNDFTIGHYYIDQHRFEKLKTFEIQKDDVLITCSGTIGKVAVVPENVERGIINQALLKITLDKSRMLPEFFKIIFESDFIKEELAKLTPGSAMKNITSMKELKKVVFPVPPLPEQHRILAHLDFLNKKKGELKNFHDKTEKETEEIIPSILNKAFNGES